MGLNPFLTFYIDGMLNFDGDVDANANANVKCEQGLMVYSHVLSKSPFFSSFKNGFNEWVSHGSVHK